MRVVKGQEWTSLAKKGAKPKTVRVLKVVKNSITGRMVDAVVRDIATGLAENVRVVPEQGLVGFGLTAAAPKKTPKEQTPPDLRRMPFGSKRGPNVMMDATSAEAYEFVLDWVKANPDKELPANQSGAFCLAMREFAAKRGWTFPVSPPTAGA